jgi:hypothetical protein
MAAQGSWEDEMGLPVRQQRTLDEIEGRLAGSDPRLKSLFSIFSRLTRGEAMPWFENVRVRPIADRFLSMRMWFHGAAGRPAKRARLILVLPAALSAMACAVLIAFGFPSTPRISHAGRPPGRELVVKPNKLCRIGLLRAPTFC